jgi:hypothetical protein
MSLLQDHIAKAFAGQDRVDIAFMLSPVRAPGIFNLGG